MALVVTDLLLQHGEVDGAAVEPSWRAGLQPAEGEPQRFKAGGEAQDRLFAQATGGSGFLATMDQTTEEGPGGQHHRTRSEAASVEQRDASDMAVMHLEVVDFALDDLEVGLRRDRCLHGFAIELAVGLGAGSANGRALAAIEDAELDARLVGDPAHETIERIDLADEVTLAEPTDGRIAAHLTDGRALVGDQCRGDAEARRGGRGFRPGMAAADNDDIEVAHDLDFPENAGLGQCFT
jgi:hypothetical protein